MSNRALSAEKSPDVSAWAQQAEYHQLENPLYQDNPLVEALPELWDKETVFRTLRYRPKFKASYRELPDEVRIDMLENIAHIYQPLSKHLEIYYRLSRAIRGGYVGRDLFQTPRATGIKPGAFAPQPKPKGRALGRGFYIIGMSGMGKTSSIEKLLEMYPQVIWHSDYRGRPIMNAQIPWLKLDCPKDGSLKSLCISFFFALDRLLGTNYHAIYGKGGKATVDQMQTYMAFLGDLLKIGVLVIDEIQNLNRAKSGGADGMLNFFVGLSNVIRLPVILIGTFEAFDIFTKEFRQMRRGVRQGSVVWERMERDDPSWDILLKGLWRYQYTRHPVELTSELSDALYYISQGVSEFAGIGFLLAQERAITSGVESLNADIIRSVTVSDMRIAAQTMADIRQDNRKNLQKYNDVLVPIELQPAYSRHPQKKPARGVSGDKTTASSAKPRGKRKKKNKSKEPSPDIIPSENDLRRSLAADDVYSALKESGVIGTTDN